MPTISKLHQAILSARQAGTVELMAELAAYEPRLHIDGLPRLPPRQRCPRFAPARHRTPAGPDLLGRWRDNLRTLAETPLQTRIADGAMYRPVFRHGHALYTPSGRLLCRLPPDIPEDLERAIFQACAAWAQSQEIIL